MATTSEIINAKFKEADTRIDGKFREVSEAMAAMKAELLDGFQVPQKAPLLSKMAIAGSIIALIGVFLLSIYFFREARAERSANAEILAAIQQVNRTASEQFSGLETKFNEAGSQTDIRFNVLNKRLDEIQRSVQSAQKTVPVLPTPVPVPRNTQTKPAAQDREDVRKPLKRPQTRYREFRRNDAPPYDDQEWYYEQ